jgi:hypothetical protein
VPWGLLGGEAECLRQSRRPVLGEASRVPVEARDLLRHHPKELLWAVAAISSKWSPVVSGEWSNIRWFSLSRFMFRWRGQPAWVVARSRTYRRPVWLAGSTGGAASHRSPEQIANSLISRTFPDARTAYKIPNAMVGYQPGYSRLTSISSPGVAARRGDQATSVRP